MAITVVIDTNFIVVPAQFGVDIFSEAERVLEGRVEFVILSTALDELKRRVALPRSKVEERHFRVALNLVERCKVIGPDGLPPAASVDEQILLFAESIKGVLATNDRLLRRRARAKGVPVLFLRQQRYLALDGSVI